MNRPDDFFLHCDKALASTIPFFGVWRARKAIDDLVAHANKVEAQSRLVAASTHRDQEVSTKAQQALRNLRDNAAIDAFCRLAQDKPESAAAKLAVECRYRPSEPEEAAVFLILTGQIDAYFQEHDGLRDLRAGYGRSDEATRIRLMTVARTGDARLVEFILRPRLSLRQCSDKELAETLATHLRRKDWPRMFNDCRTLPLRHSLVGWQSLISGDWSPTDPADAALFTAIAAEFKTSAAPLPPPVAPKGTSAVFERWLAEGRQSALTSLGESALLQKLAAATPPEAVPLVSALATLPQTSEATRKQVATSEHWMIRLAGLATGLTQDLAGSIDVSNDRNFWVRELAGADAVWNFWPEDSTPVLLQKLDSAPREAWIGEPGRVRRILRILLAHGMTGGTWVQDTVAIDEDAIVVTKTETAPMKRKN